MLAFWILATLMVALAAAFVVVPLLRARAPMGPSEKQANLEVLRAQRREIEADVAAGTLAPGARAEAIEELVERAATDLAGRDEPAAPDAPQTRRPWLGAAAAGLLIPALAFPLYIALGTPQATDATVAAAARGQASDQQIAAMVENLARKVRERPDDAQGWGLLARSMAALGRFDESAEAYAHLAKLVPNDAQVLADYADSLGMAQGKTLKGEPYTLVKKALAIDPNHRKALALAGTAALDEGDFALALRHWEKLAAGLPADSPDASQVATVIAEIRQRASASGKALPAAATAPVAAATAPKAGTGGSVSGSVGVAAEIAPRVKGDETLFIYARAENGSRMPLAILRGTARQLPMVFTLDDSQAMSPTAKLSMASMVRIEARVSRSGNAMPQPGDLVGSSIVVKPGARDVKVVIDKVLP